MVKVDAYLAQGKKEQAAQEIMQAMRLGLNFDLKDKIPLDIDLAYKRLTDSVLTVSPAKEESEAEALSRRLYEQIHINIFAANTQNLFSTGRIYI